MPTSSVIKPASPRFNLYIHSNPETPEKPEETPPSDSNKTPKSTDNPTPHLKPFVQEELTKEMTRPAVDLLVKWETYNKCFYTKKMFRDLETEECDKGKYAQYLQNLLYILTPLEILLASHQEYENFSFGSILRVAALKKDLLELKEVKEASENLKENFPNPKLYFESMQENPYSLLIFAGAFYLHFLTQAEALKGKVEKISKNAIQLYCFKKGTLQTKKDLLRAVLEEMPINTEKATEARDKAWDLFFECIPD